MHANIFSETIKILNRECSKIWHAMRVVFLVLPTYFEKLSHKYKNEISTKRDDSVNEEKLKN